MNAEDMMLPITFPDMTLHSLIALIQRMSGLPTAKEVSAILFGSERAALRHDFPSHLQNFEALTNGLYGVGEQVATEMTTLPYFLCFRPAEDRSASIALMLGETVARLKFVLGLPPSPTRAFQAFRFCPECLDADRTKYGIPYWRRNHQLPTSLICHIHGCSLFESSIRRDGTGRSAILLPEDSLIQQCAVVREAGAGAAILKRLAKLGVSMLTYGAADSISSSALQYAYMHGLRQQGLLTQSGRIRATELTARIAHQYAALATVDPFDRIVGANNVHSFLTMLRSPRGFFSSARHTVLIDFLFGEWEMFRSVLAWEKQMELPLIAAADPQPALHQPLTDPELLRKLSMIQDRLKDPGASVRKICTETGVCIDTAMRWLGRLGMADIPKRPRVLSAEVRDAIVVELETGEPLKDIGDRYQLSKSTIDRLCNEVPGLHSRWRKENFEWKRQRERYKFIETLRIHPKITTSQLRKTPDSGYSWLSRNDRNWLSENLPMRNTHVVRHSTQRRPAVDWEARDRQLLECLESLENPIVLKSWERKKAKAILRRLPKLPFLPRLNRLPMSNAAVNRLLGQLRREVR